MLINDVEDVLEKAGFDYCLCDGCFDIAAQRDFTIFLKVLGNVDSFQESQATNLKIISRDFDAAVAVVGLHTRRENLIDNIVYERFDIPTFTPGTLENIVINEMFPSIYRSRGGLFTEINPIKLRKMREKAGLSQSELARQVGVTKKSIYEHEKERKKALFGIVKRIEMIIGNVSDPLVLDFEYSDARNAPKETFERQVLYDLKRIGFATDVVYQTPFNIVAKNHRIMLLSRADENRKRIEKTIHRVSELSNLTDIPALAVTRDEMDLDIPTLQEKELRHMRSTRDLRKILK